MKGFVFRLIAVILLIIAVFSAIYKDALAYRKNTFDPSQGDIIYDSMIFTDMTTCTEKDGAQNLVVGGTVYPEDNRNAPKNVFFKLYNSTGAMIATVGINEVDHSLLLNGIEKTPTGFALLCEARGETDSYGKVYHYSSGGEFIESVVIDYADKVAQVPGTEYGISFTENKVYYTAVDSEKTVCADADGKYLFDIKTPENTTVCDVSVTDNTVYTVGSEYDKYNIPKAYISAFRISDASLLWTEKELMTNAPTEDAIYSQTDDMTIITKNGKPTSILLSGKYFDTGVYKKYITDNKLETEEDIDTISKKSLRNDFSLYRIGRTKMDYIKSPCSSAFIISADINGNVKKTNLYATYSNKSVSSVSLSSSVAEDTADFSACIISVDAVKTDSEVFKTTITGIDANLKETYTTVTTENTTHKTYFSAASKDKFFTYSTINTSDKYAAHSYTLAEYQKHLAELENATNDINLIYKAFELIPLACMISLMYVLTRIRSIKRGGVYIPKSLFLKKEK